jgi:RNA polymerase sigma-70 factor (ECF subfamily)
MAHPQRIDPDRLDEAALIARAVAGDGGAFRTLMQRGNQRLFRIARGVVRDDAEAEDVLQESWMRGFAALRGFRGDSGLMTWMTRIVLNEANGRLRRRKSMATLDQDDRSAASATIVRFPTGAAIEDPEAGAARAEIRRLLEHAVDDLPDAFRMVFILRDIEGCSIVETAAALDVKPETVKTRLHRARRILREGLQARIGATLSETFPFLGARCARVTDAVLTRLAAAGNLSARD